MTESNETLKRDAKIWGLAIAILFVVTVCSAPGCVTKGPKGWSASTPDNVVAVSDATRLYWAGVGDLTKDPIYDIASFGGYLYGLAVANNPNADTNNILLVVISKMEEYESARTFVASTFSRNLAAAIRKKIFPGKYLDAEVEQGVLLAILNGGPKPVLTLKGAP